MLCRCCLSLTRCHYPSTSVICPECLESFASGDNLTCHFADIHGALWGAGENEVGSARGADLLPNCSVLHLDKALLEAPTEFAAADLQQQREAKLLRSTLLELEGIAVEQPMNALAIFAEGFGVFADIADKFSPDSADMHLAAAAVQRVNETDERLQQLIADLDEAASTAVHLTVKRGAENARVGRESIKEGVMQVNDGVNRAIDKATGVIGDALGDAAGLAQAVETTIIGWGRGGHHGH
jgi:hypothetical protein